MLPAILVHFQNVTDPRMARTRLHSLTTILAIALCAVLCGANTWVEMEEYGKAKQAWLAQWLDLTNGIPSHDTFARVFARLQTPVLGRCLQELTELLMTRMEKHLALDGKYLRHSFDAAAEKGPLVMLNAWACSQRLVLASVPVDLKSNEIKAIPELLALLDITGCVVTIDAMGTQTALANQIIASGGDYVLALKGNQESLHDDTRRFFEYASEKNGEDRPYSEAVTTTVERGRTEVRRCLRVLLSDLQGLWDDTRQKWTGLCSLVRLESERTVHGETSREARYYVSSLCTDAAYHLKTIRSHWGVENSLHYVLDVAFNEDASRIRKDYAPANFALLRQMALNLLRQEKTQKNGIAVKRSKAGWDNAYLFKVLDNCSQLRCVCPGLFVGWACLRGGFAV